MKLRYQSYVITGLPLFTAKAPFQKPMMPLPEPSTQAGVFSLCQPASRNCQPANTRTTSHNQLARVFWNRNFAIGGARGGALARGSLPFSLFNIIFYPLFSPVSVRGRSPTPLVRVVFR